MPATRAHASAAEPGPAAAPETAPPLGAAEFAALMAGLGFDGACPSLAVAVSGGADSLALTLLAAGWARARGTALVAFTVDHGLRAESAEEARRVAGWLVAAGIVHETLTPDPPLAPGAAAAAARGARYDALAAACRRRGVDHLLLAHHRGDQAETVLMRAARGTGLTGAAGMAPLDRRNGLVLCRPLLTVAPARLRATLRRRGQNWVEDPSNADLKSERVRVRRWLAGRPDGMAPAIWATKVAAPALRRLESELAALADEAVRVFPEGHAWLHCAHLARQPEVLVRHLLGRLLTGVAGAAYPPRGRALDGAVAALRAGRAMTAHGCLLRPWRGGLLLAREPAAIAGPAFVGMLPGRRWDGRFVIAADVPDHWEIGVPEAQAWTRAVRDVVPQGRRTGELPPGPVRAGLPVFRDSGRCVAVPFAPGEAAPRLRFVPRNPLIRGGLRVALPGSELI